jgi:oligopeptide/dipeptide ABC transporter ATP-binding protein
MTADAEIVLAIDGLTVDLPLADGRRFLALDHVSLTVRRGEILGLVGESGSGKSMLSLAVLGLTGIAGERITGRILLLGEDVLGLSPAAWRRLRGSAIGMIFQDPMTGLNPVRSVGSVLCESVRRHQGLEGEAARQAALAALRSVGIPSPQARLKAYPHQLSGGLRQRVMIALALINAPAVIIADEPTTALDTTIQAQILDLLRARLSDRAGGILITHDLGVAAEICKHLVVIYQGTIVEQGPTAEVLARPFHPYTRGLLDAAPRFDRPRGTLVPIRGQPPRPGDLEPGCPFRSRCDRQDETCAKLPDLDAVAPNHRARCWHPIRELALCGAPA